MARTTSRRRSQGNKDSSPRVKTTTPSPEKDNVGNKTASATQTKKKSKKMSTTRIIVSWMMTIYALLMFFFMQKEKVCLDCFVCHNYYLFQFITNNKITPITNISEKINDFIWVIIKFF